MGADLLSKPQVPEPRRRAASLLPGVEFEDSWMRRITVKFDDVVVPVIGKADLIRNKRAVGRAQDPRDAPSLSLETSPRRAHPKRGKK